MLICPMLRWSGSFFRIEGCTRNGTRYQRW